jgi:hypothetical protein
MNKTDSCHPIPPKNELINFSIRISVSIRPMRTKPSIRPFSRTECYSTAIKKQNRFSIRNTLSVEQVVIGSIHCRVRRCRIDKNRGRADAYRMPQLFRRNAQVISGVPAFNENADVLRATDVTFLD